MLDRQVTKRKRGEEMRAPDAAATTGRAAAVAGGTVIAADRYVPGLVRAVANKLEGGASRFYRKNYGIGLSEWHILVALAADPWITSPVLCKNAGLDKAAVSRSLARMEEQGLVSSRDTSGRSRATALTAKGRRLHDRIAQVALQREEQLLAEFSPKQVDSLIGLLTALSKAAAGLTDAAPRGAGRRKKAAE
ncbi:MarR family winged helix-turn-helix transcriptional regulator [Acidisoma sp. C75]